MDELGADRPWYAGRQTFLRAPLVDFDAVRSGMTVISGAPHSLRARFGERGGPRGIREGSAILVDRLRNARGEGFVDAATGTRLFLPSDTRLVDVGDLNVYPSDVARTTEGIAGGVAEVVRRGGFSVCLGGDHYVGYPSCLGYMRAVRERSPGARVGYVHIDGHLDFADRIGGYGKYNNGTNARRISELEGIVPSSMVFIGIQGPCYLDQVQAIRRLGSRVVHFGRSYNEAYLEALRAQEAGGATFVHAFDDPDVVAGQGTVAVELLRQLDEQAAGADTVLVPVGGGGLVSGISLYLKARRPGVRVIGVEPSGADALTRSLEAERLVTLDRVTTMADGLAASAPGPLTLRIAQQHVDGMIRVAESEMLRAIRLYFEWEHLLAEPAGAAALAALLYHYTPQASERVVVVLSGANVTDEVMVRALRAR